MIFLLVILLANSTLHGEVEKKLYCHQIRTVMSGLMSLRFAAYQAFPLNNGKPTVCSMILLIITVRNLNQEDFFFSKA